MVVRLVVGGAPSILYVLLKIFDSFSSPTSSSTPLCRSCEAKSRRKKNVTRIYASCEKWWRGHVSGLSLMLFVISARPACIHIHIHTHESFLTILIYGKLILFVTADYFWKLMNVRFFVRRVSFGSGGIGTALNSNNTNNSNNV
jgi:hypothetical protein